MCYYIFVTGNILHFLLYFYSFLLNYTMCYYTIRTYPDIKYYTIFKNKSQSYFQVPFLNICFQGRFISRQVQKILPLKIYPFLESLLYAILSVPFTSVRSGILSKTYSWTSFISCLPFTVPNLWVIIIYFFIYNIQHILLYPCNLRTFYLKTGSQDPSIFLQVQKILPLKVCFCPLNPLRQFQDFQQE